MNRFEFCEASLEAFHNICDKWHVSTKNQNILLGVENKNKQYLVRTSHILTIYKLLQSIFFDEEQADEWVRKPNKVFKNKSALDIMLEEDITGMVRVKKYLESIIVN